MGADAADRAAESDAGTGCCCRCIYAWRNGSELYVSGVAGDADPVYMIGRAVNDVTINGIFGAGGDTLFDMYSLAVCMWCLAIPLRQLQEHITSTGRLWSFMPVPASMKSANCPGCFTISGSISG